MCVDRSLWSCLRSGVGQGGAGLSFSACVCILFYLAHTCVFQVGQDKANSCLAGSGSRPAGAHAGACGSDTCDFPPSPHLGQVLFNQECSRNHLIHGLCCRSWGSRSELSDPCPGFGPPVPSGCPGDAVVGVRPSLVVGTRCLCLLGGVAAFLTCLGQPQGTVIFCSPPAAALLPPHQGAQGWIGRVLAPPLCTPPWASVSHPQHEDLVSLARWRAGPLLGTSRLPLAPSLCGRRGSGQWWQKYGNQFTDKVSTLQAAGGQESGPSLID